MILLGPAGSLYPRAVEAPTDAIVPEPTPAVRDAILAALRENDAPSGGWAAAALVEGVDADDDEA